MLVVHQKCVIVVAIKEHSDGTHTDRFDRRPHRPGTMDSRGPRQNRKSDSKTKAQSPKRPATEIPTAGDQSRAMMLDIVFSDNT